MASPAFPMLYQSRRLTVISRCTRVTQHGGRASGTRGLAMVTRVAQASSSFSSTATSSRGSRHVQLVPGRHTVAIDGSSPAEAAATGQVRPHNSITLPTAMAAQAAEWLVTRKVMGGAAAAATKTSTPAHLPAAFIRNTAVFAAGAALLATMAATATSPDWQQDATFFISLLAGLWGISCWRPFRLAPQLLMVAMHLPHMAGCWGAYHWSLGNLSWDILVHIWGGFAGTLLAYAAANGELLEPGASQQLVEGSLPSSGSSVLQHMLGGGPHHNTTSRVQQHAPLGRTLVVLALVFGVATGVEVLEGSDGPALMAGHSAAHAAPTAATALPAVLPQGEGLFKPGPGDFCLSVAPCTNQEDTTKDMADNAAGALLALTALRYNTLAASTTRARGGAP